MTRTWLDGEVERIDEQVAVLPARQVAAYFASAAERLMPLYEGFVNRERWGDPDVLRRALDSVWAALERNEVANWSTLLVEVEMQTPHGDDFDSDHVIFAQDACIGVDAAIQALLGTQKPQGADFVFEALRVAACLEQTGSSDLGSGSQGDKFEEGLVSDARIQKELAMQRADLAELGSPVPANYDRLRRRGVENGWSIEMLLPGERN